MSGDALVLAVACALGVGACAERFGQRAVAGAAEGLRQQRAQHPDEQPARRASHQAVKGALDALDTPDQRARVEKLVAGAASDAAQAAVRDAARRLILELGPEGDGPLSVSIAGTSEQAARAALGGARQELVATLPACGGSDPSECLRAYLQELARASAIGFATGLRQTIGWPLLVLAFAIGLAGGVAGSWLWSTRGGVPARRRITKPA